MVDISSDCTTKRTSPQLGTVILKVETPATADNGDTVDITLSNYGIKTLEGILGFTHSTTDSVVVTEAPTTSVSSDTLTITIGGSTANKKRTFFVFGDSS